MSQKALALDIGGTKIYNTIVDENGNICGEIEKHSTPKTIDEFNILLKNIFSKYENDVDIIAIATAGAVNNENNKVISSTGNLPKGYNQINFQALSNKKVFLENDANAAAWAEHILGASKNCPYSIILTLGTGVGGGIILNNKLYKGKSGGAGEMHFKMYADKRRRCSCGSWDCFEAYASGTGLRKTAQEILNNQNITTYDVIEGVKNGDEKMQQVFTKWQDDILAGLIGLTNLFDPDCIVLSGSMAEFVDTNYLESSVNEEIVTTPIKVYRATAGNYSGMIGAALLAMSK
ncbi:MAG: ROK family protein [Candidatus Gastranaerophilales bacterium]|nr:ROK family protein [Candidatus Gastranaerophilales bacterium]